ncbi:MAG TPA: O-antigen ligase family protein [Phaeodactylibacter sp.]|nr:O-antigen ligase family protein [Phaeodactylibacter sp.]
MFANLFGISKENVSTKLFTIYGAILLLSIFIGIATNFYYLLALPAVLLVGFITVVDFKKIFYLTLFFIPLSIEMTLPGGIGTDFPPELFVIGLMLVYFLFFIKNIKNIGSGFFKHPLTILVLFHLVWTLIATIHSYNYVVSVKFLLAKLWYVIVFYFMAGLLIKTEKDFKNLFWVFFFPLFIAITYVMTKHASMGFAFNKINACVGPFYRNHVMYGCIVTLFLPFIWYVKKWYPKWSLVWWFLVGALVYALLAVQFSYTRAAYVGIIIAILAVQIIRFRLMKLAVGAAIILALGVVGYLVSNNNFMDYAPEYKSTVSHNRFDNLISATAKGKDISTMERVYRWVAGYQMSKKEPLTGFGPGNFYGYYKRHTVTNFKTYVSDNPEHSGIHNYYLMLIVEQGFMGVFIFLAMCFYMLIRGETIYHNTQDPKKKYMVMTVVLTMIIIDSLLLINDMIETDKIGAFFFIGMAILVNIDVENESQIPSKL